MILILGQKYRWIFHIIVWYNNIITIIINWSDIGLGWNNILLDTNVSLCKELFKVVDLVESALFISVTLNHHYHRLVFTVKTRVAQMKEKLNQLLKDVDNSYNMALIKLPMTVRKMLWLEQCSKLSPIHIHFIKPRLLWSSDSFWKLIMQLRLLIFLKTHNWFHRQNCSTGIFFNKKECLDVSVLSEFHDFWDVLNPNQGI